MILEAESSLVKRVLANTGRAGIALAVGGAVVAVLTAAVPHDDGFTILMAGLAVALLPCRWSARPSCGRATQPGGLGAAGRGA